MAAPATASAAGADSLVFGASSATRPAATAKKAPTISAR
jgi:hypothetical protein